MKQNKTQEPKSIRIKGNKCRKQKGGDQLPPKGILLFQKQKIQVSGTKMHLKVIEEIFLEIRKIIYRLK